jgi:AcrR family transcriptional regulator
MIATVAGSTLTGGSPRRSPPQRGRPSSTALEQQRRPERRSSGERGSTRRAERRATQRQRLLSAVKQLAIEGSAEELTVAEIVAAAGVSRPTFYEYFSDREDCFLQALRPGAQQLLGAIEASVAACEPAAAPSAAVGALVAFACERPGIARLLMSDALAGGRAALDARDRLIGQAARIIERTAGRTADDALIPAISPRLLLGVTSRLLATRLDRGDQCFAELEAELCAWLQSYSLTAAQRVQRIVSAQPKRAPTPLISTQLRPPAALSRAPGRAPDRALSENQWLRIVFATAAIVARDGYAAATVAEIVRVAGLDNRAFYRLFACKEQALADARELMFGHTMALTAGAFATAVSWPERVFQAAQAFTECVEQNPTLAYVSFVESHAGGPVAMARLPQLIGAFTIFLQEGYRYFPPGAPAEAPSPLALEAIVTAVFELCHLRARETGPGRSRSQLAELVFICVAPFLGAAQTSAFLLERCARDPRPGVPPATGSRSPAADR